MSRAFHSGLNSTPKVETTLAAGQTCHLNVQQTQTDTQLFEHLAATGLAELQ
jgi:hypothetical protein